jgi:hypothetical protein
MKKYLIVAFLIASCGPEVQILPPNEDQYAVCQKAIDCSIITDDKIEACAICIGEFAQRSRYTTKQIKASMVNAECSVVKSYSETSGIRQCIK